MDNEEKLDKVYKMLTEIHNIVTNNDNKEIEKMFRNWAVFYGLSLGADILTGQSTAPTSFL